MISPLVGLVLLALPLTTSPRPLTAVPADALVFRSSSTLSSFAIASSSSSSLGQVCPGCTSFGDVAQVCFLQAGAGGDFNKTLGKSLSSRIERAAGFESSLGCRTNPRRSFRFSGTHPLYSPLRVLDRHF